MKMNKKVILSFILGSLIFSTISVYATAVIAKDIEFTPNNSNWNVNNVEDALNDLYSKTNNKNQSIFYGSKKGASLTNHGFGYFLKIDENDFSYQNYSVAVKETGKYKFTISVLNSDSAGAKPKFDLRVNEISVNYQEGYTGYEPFISEQILELNKDDIIELYVAGPGNVYAVYYTVIEQI